MPCILKCHQLSYLKFISTPILVLPFLTSLILFSNVHLDYKKDPQLSLKRGSGFVNALSFKPPPGSGFLSCITIAQRGSPRASLSPPVLKLWLFSFRMYGIFYPPGRSSRGSEPVTSRNSRSCNNSLRGRHRAATCRHRN